ncbi:MULTISPECIES: hypothetical protein [Bacillus]|uniref:hypothetical protein n=1 Tax=Bacillus TaxID=1386 RepID=UPI0003628FF0|nr:MULTISPECIES: hypothetical protein [Bacillus]
MLEEILYVFKMLFGFFLCIQWASVLIFLIVEWAMVDYYKFGTFEDPESIVDNVQNFAMNLILGTGFYFYSKFSKRNWFVRKLYMFITLIVLGILFIIIFNVITIPLDFLFGLFS